MLLLVRSYDHVVDAAKILQVETLALDYHGAFKNGALLWCPKLLRKHLLPVIRK
jgi:hypothetical protein